MAAKNILIASILLGIVALAALASRPSNMTAGGGFTFNGGDNAGTWNSSGFGGGWRGDDDDDDD